MGPFGEYANEFIQHAVPVIPVGGEDGKIPRVKNYQRMGIKASKQLIASKRFDDENIAFIAGKRSGITVLDIDDPSPKALNTALARFGESPIIVKTGSGKWHAYYRYNGEQRLIRPTENIDILGDGICVAPPSVRPDKNNTAYEFVAGDLNDLSDLPFMDNVPDDGLKMKPGPESSAIAKGERNSALFQFFLKSFAAGLSAETVYEQGLQFNRTSLEESLRITEVDKTFRSAKSYHIDGRNWCNQEARAIIQACEERVLSSNPYAVHLLIKLRHAHGWRHGHQFALANAAAEAWGWSLHKFREARRILEEHGFICCVHRGGNGPKDPPKYVLC